MENENLFDPNVLPGDGRVELALKVEGEIAAKNLELEKIKWEMVDHIADKIKSKLKDENLIKLLEASGSNGDKSVPHAQEPLLRGLLASSLKLSKDKKNICFNPCSHAILAVNIKKVYEDRDALKKAVNKLNGIIFAGRPVIKFIDGVFQNGNTMVDFTFNR